MVIEVTAPLATRVMIRLRYTSAYLTQRLKTPSTYRWVGWCLNGIIKKTKEELHLSIFSDLRDVILIGQVKPLLDEQRTKGQSYRLCGSARRRVELRQIMLTDLAMASERR